MSKEIVNMVTIKNEKIARSWYELNAKVTLSERQQKQLFEFLHFLLSENEKINLTAITDPANVIRYHFNDSLIVNSFISNYIVTGICDVGSGGGFPGIPLAIAFPHIQVTLIEVVQKKIQFLHEVIDRLCLSNVTVYQKDWRTFLRTTSIEANVFVARASLHPKELLRIFKPSSVYKEAMMIYWASVKWEASVYEKKYIKDIHSYTVGYKQRKLYFFKNKESV